MNNNGVTPDPRPARSVSYDEALDHLASADAAEDFVDLEGYSGANTWPVRRALQVSKRRYAHAQVCATLAVADELRKVLEALTAVPVFTASPRIASKPEITGAEITRALSEYYRQTGQS